MLANDYERKEFEKFKTLVDMAIKNSGSNAISISTVGHEPMVAMKIEGYVLRKFIREDLE